LLGITQRVEQSENSINTKLFYC